ncbi:MAG: carbohydrate-binding domain-containing protein [Acetobacteraceae bacterium]
MGSFAAGQHTVSVDFLNDAFGGTATTDRNLYVTHATIDGTTVAGGSLSLMSSGSQSFAFQAPGPSNSGGGSTGGSGASGGSSGGNTSTSTGSGADTLTLGVSGMPGRETPQFTVSVDGQQVGGVRTATAQHSAGAINQMTISGNWGSGPHTLGISFINDAFGGTSATDRNLYVNSASYDGRQVPGTPTALMSNGTTNLAIPGASASTGGTLNLHLAEDAYQGDAQFTVAVDGKSLGAAQSVTALNANGRLADFSFADTLGAGSHDVAVSFINDLYGRTAATDRNLYVKGIDYNGTALPGATATLDSTGTPTSNLVVPTT